ncbi:MAG: PIN domain-containing protein [Syntrophales bacterium]
MRVFIDTSAFYALLDRDNGNHAKAHNAWSGIPDAETPAVTSKCALVETVALLERRLGPEAVRGFEGAIVPALHVEYVTADLRRKGINASFVFDSRFKEQCFRLLP